MVQEHTTRDNSTFITFDVVNFYPSINRELMLKALEFAQRFVVITPAEKDIILQAKNTLLFHSDTRVFPFHDPSDTPDPPDPPYFLELWKHCP